MLQDRQWNLTGRGHHCAHSGAAFAEDEEIYTALFFDDTTETLERRDYSVEGWTAVSPSLQPYSFWKSRYVPPPPPDARPEVFEKESADALLKRLIAEDAPETLNARYILAVMLERRRILTQTDAKTDRRGRRLLIFRHRKTDEIFLVPDPDLRLDELEGVQAEVSALLGQNAPSSTKVSDASPAQSATASEPA